MDLERFKGKKIALLGFAVENISVAKFLLKHNIDFIVLDQAPVEQLSKEAQKEIKDARLASSVGLGWGKPRQKPRRKRLKIKTGENYLSELDKFDIIIRSPGVKYLTPEIQGAKKAGREITSSTKLFFVMKSMIF